MKSYLSIVLLLLFSLSFALPIKAPDSSPKMFHLALHNAGSLSMETSNLGFSENLVYSQAGIKFLFKGAPWISGKRPRRNDQGSLLYWLSDNPHANPETVTADDPLWHAGLKVVIDSLTTVGYDGDRDLYEFLPAYNPLCSANPGVPYAQYNTSDVVLKSILGSPAPRPFAVPDPLGNYCFTSNQGGTFETPGFETLSAYYYDYCPFGTTGDRDWGINRGLSTHYPLGLAVHRESYAWPLQVHDKVIVFKYTLFNTSEQDTLYDVAISEYTDCDIGPEVYGYDVAMDDVSGYVKGPGYEFAYSRDFDGDGGITPYIFGQKILTPGLNLNRAAWYWRVGDGPNDSNPRSFNYAPRRTSNEKYWLATGRNANDSKFSPLRPEQSDIMEYEQPAPNDTRVLNTVYGSVPSQANPNPEGRLHLPPLANMTYYTVYFIGNNLDDLKARSIAIESWIDSGFDLGNVSDLTCLPYLYAPQVLLPATLQLFWQSYSNPDHFEVKYKLYSDPASQWTSIDLAGSARSYDIIGLDPDAWYQIKVASIFNPGANEIYLESETKLVNIHNIVENEDLLQSPGVLLSNYPNPFNPSTTISFSIPAGMPCRLEIFNLRGQKVKTLLNENMIAGKHSIIWNGEDDGGRKVSSGVYLYRLSTPNSCKTAKMLLMK